MQHFVRENGSIKEGDTFFVRCNNAAFTVVVGGNNTAHTIGVGHIIDFTDIDIIPEPEFEVVSKEAAE